MAVEVKKRRLSENVSTTSSTARYTGGVGSSNVTQTSSSARGGGGGGSTVAVNPDTFAPDGSSTFRVDASQVNNPPKTTGKGLTGDNRSKSYLDIARSNAPTGGSAKIRSENIIKSDINGVDQVAIRGTVANNIERVESVTVAVDKKGVETFNEDLKSKGINNAGDFFNAFKTGEAKTSGEFIVFKNKPSSQSNSFIQSDIVGNNLFAPTSTPIGNTTKPRNDGVKFVSPFSSKSINTVNAVDGGDYFTSKSNELSFKRFRTGKTEYSIAAFGVSTFGAATRPVRNPVGFVKDTFGFFKSAVTNPVGTAKQVGSQALNSPENFAGEIVGQGLFFKGFSRVSPVKVSVVKDTNLGMTKGVVVDYPKIAFERSVFLKFGNKETNLGNGITVVNDYPTLLTKNEGLKVSITSEQKSFNSPRYKQFLNTETGRLYQDFLNTELEFKNLPDAKPVPETPVVSKTGKQINFFKQPSEPDGFTISSSSDRTIADSMSEQGRIFNVKTGEFEAGASKKSSSRFLDDAEDSSSLGVGGSSSDSILGKSSFNDLSGRKQNQQLFLVEETTTVVKPFVKESTSAVNFKFLSVDNNVLSSGSNSVKIGSFSNTNNVIGSKSSYDVVSKPSSSTILGSSTSSFSSGRVGSSSVLGSKTVSSLGQVQGVNSVQSVKSSQVQKQSQVQKSLSLQKSLTKSVLVEKTTTLKPFSFKKDSGFGKFGVEVRRGGKFFSVGKGLSFSKAYGKGASVVGNSAAATFRITQRGKPISVNSQSSSFYSKGTNVIEKRSRRIKSRGELSEITYKGIKSQRKRSSVF